MTTPIDTTRLRADVVELIELGGCEPGDLTNDDAHRLGELHTQVFVGSTILALLDEVERLDERLGLAYPRALQAAADVVLDCAARWRATEESVEMHEIGDSMEVVADRILELTEEQIDALDAQVEREHAAAVAPKPERPVVIWHHREDDEELPGGCDVDEAIYYAIHAAGWGMCGELKRPDMLGETVTVYGFARMQPTLAAWRYLESAIEDLDEEHGSPDGPFKATPAMVAASETFARTMEREYVSWACDVVETRVVNVREWCAVHRPEWLAQLPAAEPEEGGTR